MRKNNLLIWKNNITIILIMFMFFISIEINADIITLSNGNKIKGKMYIKDENTVIIRVSCGCIILNKEDIKSVNKSKVNRKTKPKKYKKITNYKNYRDLIKKIAKRYNIDHKLIISIIKQESNFNRYAVSKKGARGLMQLMPPTAKKLGVTNSFDPYQNIDGGVRYFKYLYDKFDKNYILALAAYNAGPNNVIKYGHRIPPFPETRNYVKRVIAHYKQLKANV